MPKANKKSSNIRHTFNAHPDTLDFRDKMFSATLCEVPIRIELDEYKKWQVPILDQGREGACTGFGLATVANYLLRKRMVDSDKKAVSPRMMYEMAKRYDEWPGEDYEGSSARGAMKGWHKHGVCGEDCWPYNNPRDDKSLNEIRSTDALKRPLGAYYRVNHKDLVAMHCAMVEVGILYATAIVHEGWESIGEDGIIPYTEKVLGGHAFSIVAFDEFGFWIQNSWGTTWGKDGFAKITYDDWLMNGTDVWVARLGAPVTMYKIQSTAISHSAAAGKSEAYSFSDLRPHIISIGNNGRLSSGGNYGTSQDEIVSIFESDIPRVTEHWKKRRILLYAHGGLVSETAAVQRLADYRSSMLKSEVYPLSFIWRSDSWTTFKNVLEDSIRRRKPEGFLDSSKDFMLDRLDDALEPIARGLTGKLQWDEMKENALLSTESKNGGARYVLNLLSKLAERFDNLEIHIVGHSAGSIFHAPLVRLLTSKGKITSGYLKGQTGLGLKVSSCALWAPAITIELFKQSYLPSISNKSIEKFALFNLTDQAEQDDHCARIYNKSLLYLVSNAFEKTCRIPLFRDGIPLLGMEKFRVKDSDLHKLFTSGEADIILSPNTAELGSSFHATALAHGDFDDDEATVKATLARILNKKSTEKEFLFKSSASSMQDKRLFLA